MPHGWIFQFSYIVIKYVVKHSEIKKEFNIIGIGVEELIIIEVLALDYVDMPFTWDLIVCICFDISNRGDEKNNI